MKTRFFSLQYKILLFSFVLIFTPILIIATYSYVESSRIVKQKVSISSLNVVRQVGERIASIFSDAHNMSLFMIQSDEVRTFFNLTGNEDAVTVHTRKIGIEKFLTLQINSKSYINSIYFEGFNGLSMDTKNAVNAIDPATRALILSLKGGYIWDTGRIVNYDGAQTQVFYLIRVIRDMYKLTNNLAILKINISEDEIADIYRKESMGGEDTYYLLDKNNTILSAADKSELGGTLNLEPKDGDMVGGEGHFQTEYNGQAHLVAYYHIGPMDCRVVYLAPLRDLLKENGRIQRMMLLVTGASLVFCLLLALLFSSRVLSPLKKIRLQMKRIENEDFDVQLHFTGNDEITLLGKSFDKMSKRLNQLINQVYMSRIKQKEAELSALQAQINPHFLYNALDTIYWMGRMENAYETSRLIEALAKLFRLSLNSGREFTLLRDEVEHLRYYLLIQQKRSDGAVRFDIQVDEALLDCRVMKLVLQPLVENAILHGIDKKDGRGTVCVSIGREGENIVYRISDDGVGIDPEEISDLLRETGPGNRGLGIKNVNDRLKLYFGEAYGLVFSGRKGEGTTVTVSQPYDRGGGEAP